jgi:arylsulfatase
MTGKHTGHAWLRTNTMQPLRAEETTLAELLQARGLATAVIGKWALGNSIKAGSPLVQGFDTYFGFIDQVQAHRAFPPFLLADDRRVELPENPEKRTQASQELFTARAIEFLRAQREAPFFLYLPYTAPHADLDLPDDAPELAEYRALGWSEMPYVEQGERLYRDQPTPRAARAALIARLDRDVGRVLDTLRELGREQDTLVLFTSDNGASPEGGADLDFFRANGGLRGTKGELYEGGIRVPFLARWPGRIKPGASAFVAAAWDLLPTLTELTGGAPPAGIDGVSFLSTLLGRALEQQVHGALYWEHTGLENWQALRRGDWKLVRRRVHTKSPVSELYDLASDPGETRDRAAEQPELVAELLAALEREHVPDRKSPLLLREINPRAGRRER